jgi:hypothetical protein
LRRECCRAFLDVELLVRISQKIRHVHGVGPLHEASYLAPYEESESFAACLTYLQTAGDQTPPAIRYLLAEFMKYLLHRGRFYYPQELPAEAIAKKAKEGHIDRKLWVPLEDFERAGNKAVRLDRRFTGARLHSWRPAGLTSAIHAAPS